MHKRALTIFALSFAAVLLAGVAFAQVGVFSPPPAEVALPKDATTDEAPEAEPEETEAPPEELTPTEPAAAPEDEPAETPAEEPETDASEEEAKTEPEHDVWIEILHPKPEQVTDNKYLVFEGHVSADTRVFRGKYEAEVKYYPEEGFAFWRLALVLSSGDQRVTFEAVGPNGETATASVVVIYEPPVAEKEEEPGKYDFTAHQKYGECGETPPYDVFYGTGEPGTTVWIESAFGGGETSIGELGKWDLEVKFWEAPCNEAFQVVLETSHGDRKVFEFVRVCEEEAKDT